MVKFFSKLMSLWNELDNYIKIPSCTCGIARKVAKLIEYDKVHQFLIGLDDEYYAIVRSQILAKYPLRSLNKIFNMVQKEEHHKKVMVVG